MDRFLLDHLAQGRIPADRWQMSRRSVLAWLQEHGISSEHLTQRQREIAEKRAAVAEELAPVENRLAAVQSLAGGQLRMQRFDLVPADFEAALYVDLLRLIERGGYVVTCSRCGHPIEAKDSPHSRRQLGRLRSGRPIYHPECATEQRRSDKADWWRRRMEQV